MAGPSTTSDIPDFVRNNVFVVRPVYAGEEHGIGTAFLLHEDYTYLGHRILLTNRHCIIPSTLPGPDNKPKSEAHELADKYKALGIVPNDTPPKKVYIYRSCDAVSPHRVPFEAKWATFDDARIKMFKTASGDREGHLDLAVLYFDTPPAGLDLKGLEGFKFGSNMPQGTKAITCGFGTDTAGNAFKSKCFTVNEILTCPLGQGLQGNATDLAGNAGTAYDYLTEPGLAKGHSGGPVFDDAAYQEGDFSVRGIVRQTMFKDAEQKMPANTWAHVGSVVQQFLKDSPVVGPPSPVAQPDLTMRRFEPYLPTSA